MAELYLFKHIDALVPADEETQDILKKIPQGKSIKVKYSFPRNYENHKRFFAFIKTTFDIQDSFDNIKHYRSWVIMKSGYCETAVAPNGQVMFFPESISFDNMDEDKFKDLFSKSVDAFISVWGSRITKEKLLSVIEFV